jgi:hypothetical protein
MSVLDVVDHALLISCVHYRVRQSWQVLEPYIEVERALRKSTYMAYFEHLACVAAEADPAQLHRYLGLRKIGAHSQEFAIEFAAMDRARATVVEGTKATAAEEATATVRGKIRATMLDKARMGSVRRPRRRRLSP